METDYLLKAVHKAAAVVFGSLALAAGIGLLLKAINGGERAWLVGAIAVGAVVGLTGSVVVLTREYRKARSSYWI